MKTSVAAAVILAGMLSAGCPQQVPSVATDAPAGADAGGQGKTEGPKIRVLLVEGRPRWEYRYLRDILQRDARVEMKIWLTEGDEALAKSSPAFLPAFPGKEQLQQFDVVILGEAPSWKLQDSFADLVDRVTRGGASLVMLAGGHYTPASYAGTPIGEILPVVLPAAGDNDVIELAANVHPVITAAGKTSFARLDPNEEANAAAWSLVRPLWRVPKVARVREGATVLLELPETPGKAEPCPLVAWMPAGKGKVLYVGTDNLWRLRFTRGGVYHARFWKQALRMLTPLPAESAR